MDTLNEKLNNIKEKAINGCHIAQFKLGYYLKYCVQFQDNEKRHEDALRWLLLSASHKNKDALFLVGLCYKYGEGIEKDYKKAEEYFNLAIKYGNKFAKDSLESMKKLNK